MQKKLQLFISSTYTDLIEERQAAVQAVLDAGHIPAGMELFKAGNRTQLETIYKWIDDSDVYMLILGGRYGSVEEESGKSYTHLEYEYALNSGMPVFAVVLSDSFLQTKEEISDCKMIHEADNKEKYEKFKIVVMSKIIRIANDSKDIMIAIHTTLKDFLNECELVGWVRSDNTEGSIALLKQINNISTENRELQNELNTVKEKLRQMQVSFNESIAFESRVITIDGTYEERSREYSGKYTYIKKSIQKEITWNEMFLLWAPRLLTTLNSTKAKQELEASLKDFMGRYFSINENQFNKIKIQYYALDLIDVREVRTTAGGTAEFIKLSVKGKNYLIQNSIEKKT